MYKNYWIKTQNNMNWKKCNYLNVVLYLIRTFLSSRTHSGHSMTYHKLKFGQPKETNSSQESANWTSMIIKFSNIKIFLYLNDDDSKPLRLLSIYRERLFRFTLKEPANFQKFPKFFTFQNFFAFTGSAGVLSQNNRNISIQLK
jgi:hypothetical protein